MDIRGQSLKNQPAGIRGKRGAPLAGEIACAARPLGNATELRTPPHQVIENKGMLVFDKATGECLKTGQLSKKEAIALATKTRFDLQDTARKTLYGYYGKNVPVNAKGYEVHHRTCTCTRFLTGNNLQLVHSKEHGSAAFKGVMTCANSKTCPVCAETINQRKANEMRTAFNQRHALGLSVTMITFTVPHTAGDKIELLVDKISEALARFWRGAPAKRFKEKYGIRGNIRSFEVMHGENGWHPHFHIIVFSEKPLPVTLGGNGKPVEPKKRFVKLENQTDEWLWVLNRWQSVCRSVGLSEPQKHGLDMQNGDAASSYITKFGSNDEILKTTITGKSLTWDMADEITKGNTKTGKRGKSLSPWGILAKIAETKDFIERNKYKNLFIFYARALHGKTLIKWSRGLRSLFGLDAQSTDEQILSEEIAKCDYLCDLTPREWKYILANNLRAEVKNLAAYGDSEAIARMMYPLYSGSFDDFLKSFNARKNGTADIKDVKSEWDLIETNSEGDLVVELEKVIPVQPVKTLFEAQEIEEIESEKMGESLISLALKERVKNGLPKKQDLNNLKVDWEFINKITSKDTVASILSGDYKEKVLEPLYSESYLKAKSKY